jgi:hypothetical protein
MSRPEQSAPSTGPGQAAIERAYQEGGTQAAGDAQLALTGPQFWRSRQHMLPEDPAERRAWLRGYGKVIAWWAGAGDDVQVTDS